MAEEQETQKPKATLIKNRKTEGVEQHAEARKIRVVVKRKPKPKVVAKQREEIGRSTNMTSTGNRTWAALVVAQL